MCADLFHAAGLKCRAILDTCPFGIYQIPDLSGPAGLGVVFISLLGDHPKKTPKNQADSVYIYSVYIYGII
jgi:hypothetical protein